MRSMRVPHIADGGEDTHTHEEGKYEARRLNVDKSLGMDGDVRGHKVIHNIAIIGFSSPFS